METQDRSQAHNEPVDRAQREKVLANSGATSDNFAEPQGWALKWDGEAFPDDEEGESEGSSSPPARAC